MAWGHASLQGLETKRLTTPNVYAIAVCCSQPEPTSTTNSKTKGSLDPTRQEQHVDHQSLLCLKTRSFESRSWKFLEGSL